MTLPVISSDLDWRTATLETFHSTDGEVDGAADSAPEDGGLDAGEEDGEEEEVGGGEEAGVDVEVAEVAEGEDGEVEGARRKKPRNISDYHQQWSHFSSFS